MTDDIFIMDDKGRYRKRMERWIVKEYESLNDWI